MKKLFVMALALVALAGCKSKSSEPQEVAVSFNVSNLQVTTDSMGPHKASSLTDAKIKDLWILVNGESKIHQVSTDDGFGSVTLSLKYGVQTIDFIGGTRDGQSVSNGVWSCDKVDGTYAATLELDVTPTTPAQTIEMRHLDYLLSWMSTDNLPESVKKVELGIANWHGTLGQGLVPTKSENKVIIIEDVSSRYGKTLTANIGGFCSIPWCESDETITATFRALGANDEELFAFEKAVPVRSNRKTIISGRMFGYNEAAALSVTTGYGEEKTMPL